MERLLLAGDPGGEGFLLERRPPAARGDLRAWDAADEYLLRRTAELDPLPARRVLLINDNFGALATVLAARRLRGTGADRLVGWDDSHLAQLARRENLERNGLPADCVETVPASEDPTGPFDLVVARFPRSLAWWEDSLLRVRPLLAAGALLLGGGMIKHTPARVFRLLETVIGPTETSLGWKKARLAEVRPEPRPDLPARLPLQFVELQDEGLVLESQANVFSRGGLDLGTRLLLRHLPQREGELAAADLGCGNGVLALAMARRCPGARILGVDESHQAIASARANAERAGLSDRVEFRVGDGLDDVASGRLDLVVCNPPFHQGAVRGDAVAWQLFEQSRRALRPGGELLVVGNRHLGYHWKLSRLFGRCEQIAAHPRFVVLRAG